MVPIVFRNEYLTVLRSLSVTLDARGALVQPAAATGSLKGLLAGQRLVETLEAERRTEPR